MFLDRIARSVGTLVLIAVLTGIGVLAVAGLSSVLIYLLTFLR